MTESSPYASHLPFKVITVKASGQRVLFARHRTRRAADELVAGLAKMGLAAHVEVDWRVEDQAQPGEPDAIRSV